MVHNTRITKPNLLNFLITFTIALFVSLPINGIQFQSTSQAFQGPQRNCSYSIEIETTCARSADTRDHVSVRFSDSKGNMIIVKHLKNPKLLYAPKNGPKKQGRAYGGFGRCAIDMFESSGPCMSDKVCSMYVKKVGSDEWRPGWVKVYQHEGGSLAQISYVFYVRIFVPENVWYGFNYCHSKGNYLPSDASFGEDQ